MSANNVRGLSYFLSSALLFMSTLQRLFNFQEIFMMQFFFFRKHTFSKTNKQKVYQYSSVCLQPSQDSGYPLTVPWGRGVPLQLRCYGLSNWNRKSLFIQQKDKEYLSTVSSFTSRISFCWFIHFPFCWTPFEPLKLQSAQWLPLCVAPSTLQLQSTVLAEHLSSCVHIMSIYFHIISQANESNPSPHLQFLDLANSKLLHLLQ